MCHHRKENNNSMACVSMLKRYYNFFVHGKKEIKIFLKTFL